MQGAKRQRTFLNEYDGFQPTSNDKISNIDLAQILNQNSPSEWFFDNYVSLKKPVLINGVPKELDLKIFKLDKILDTLSYEDGSYDTVQVEKKVDGGFGSGSQREKVPFDQFINKIKEGKTDGYLTTQYEYDDNSDQENHENDDNDELEDNESNEAARKIKEAIDLKANIDLLDNESDAESTESLNFDDIHDDFDDLEDLDIDVDDNETPVVSFNNDKDQEAMYKDEAMERVHDLIQKPLTAAIKKSICLPMIPSFLDTLIPQQINVWIGSSNPTNEDIGEDDQINSENFLERLGKRIPGIQGTSSGLHHDHANNLYIPIEGTKRFTIFAPSEASNLYTVGDIEHIYGSGVIDYKVNDNAPTWKHIRSDGATIDDDDEIYDLEVESYKKSTKNVKKDPPSFSKVPPYLIHLNDVKSEKLREKLDSLKNDKFPKLTKSVSLEVQLRPGQMLYLPTGWFHEVSSYGNVHIALNYWFYPNDGEAFDKPYLDNFWPKDYIRTEKAIELYKSQQQHF